MRNRMNNAGYFIGEVKTIFRLSGFSGVLSLLSLVMIFFVLQLAMAGWWVSNALMSALKEEAEISVYYGAELNGDAIEALKGGVAAIDGVRSVSAVSAGEAYARMSEIMGKDAVVLASFDKNPFDAFLEVRIDLEKLSGIPTAVEKLKGVEYVRDNRTVLDKLSRIAAAVTALGAIVVMAVSAATFIITSHIIREGVHSNREQITTLKLLGAPDWFINAPFVIEGVLLTLAAASLSGAVFALLIRRMAVFMADSLPFLPMVDVAWITQGSVLGMLCLGVFMGAASSVFGLRMVRTV